ncbi:hypothetical protein G5I_05319 [Acromyrmex echinatior]|uniref:Uncharacterized protein n=1 Tax=Acromyrmex echinatior TaxID=103372 RepID=F4WHX2_ACREC|nr:hypothetical protein G5I_05319 [Acromyrmex echinatior]
MIRRCLGQTDETAVRLRARYDARSGRAHPNRITGAQSQQLNVVQIILEHAAFLNSSPAAKIFKGTCLRSLPDPAPSVCTIGLATQPLVVTSNGIERAAIFPPAYNSLFVQIKGTFVLSDHPTPMAGVKGRHEARKRVCHRARTLSSAPLRSSTTAFRDNSTSVPNRGASPSLVRVSGIDHTGPVQGRTEHERASTEVHEEPRVRSTEIIFYCGSSFTQSMLSHRRNIFQEAYIYLKVFFPLMLIDDSYESRTCRLKREFMDQLHGFRLSFSKKATAYLILLTGGARLRLFLASLAKESPQQSIFQSVSRFPVSR